MSTTMAERLKALRLKNQLSQTQVAHKIHVSPAMVSSYEKGEKSPSLGSLIALADIFHTSADYILGRTNSSRSYLDVTELSDIQIQSLQALIDTMK